MSKLEASGKYEDLNSVLTRISRQVALVRQSNVPSDPSLHHKRQIPLKQDTLIRQIYLKETPNEEDNTDEETSKIVDVDKAIRNSNGASPIKKIQTSLKRMHKPSLPSSENNQGCAEESQRCLADKKNSKEKCKVM